MIKVVVTKSCADPRNGHSCHQLVYPRLACWNFGRVKETLGSALSGLENHQNGFYSLFQFLVCFCSVMSLPCSVTFIVANQHFNISLEHNLGIWGHLYYQNKVLNESKSRTHQEPLRGCYHLNDVPSRLSTPLLGFKF